MSDPADIGERPGYGELTAVDEGRVYVLDDNLVSRPGPRLAEGVLEIARALHPESFDE
jgi:iron complex transport system substrate-binding protein